MGVFYYNTIQQSSYYKVPYELYFYKKDATYTDCFVSLVPKIGVSLYEYSTFGYYEVNLNNFGVFNMLELSFLIKVLARL